MDLDNDRMELGPDDPLPPFPAEYAKLLATLVRPLPPPPTPTAQMPTISRLRSTGQPT